MNVIVIIVLAVTLLTLGLIFVRGVFFKLTDLSEGVFERGQAEIAKISQGEAKLDLPSEITIKQGEAKIFEIVVGNDGTENDGTLFTLTLTRKSCAVCPGQDLVDAQVVESPATVRLNKGEIYPFSIKIAAVARAPVTTGTDTPTYLATVTTPSRGANNPYASGAFFINVEKGGFIF